MTRAVVGMASSMDHADRILCELMAADFANENISMLYPDRMGGRDFAHAAGSRAPEGAAFGAAIGGALGAAVGFALAAGVAVLPSAPSFQTAGPVMATLGGAGLGGLVGGVLGALLGVRIPRYEAHPYQGRLDHGSLVISVHVENEVERERACSIFEKEGAEAVSTVAELPVS